MDKHRHRLNDDDDDDDHDHDVDCLVRICVCFLCECVWLPVGMKDASYAFVYTHAGHKKTTQRKTQQTHPTNQPSKYQSYSIDLAATSNYGQKNHMQ